MIPLNLELLNFRSHGKTTIPFHKLSAACFQGPNGAGKSTIVAAILFALTGETGDTNLKQADRLVKLGETEMMVLYDFRQEADTYRIIRKKTLSGGGKSAVEFYGAADSSYPISVWNLIARGEEAKKKILQVIGRNFKSLTASSFLLQGQGERLIRCLPSERHQIVFEILNLSWAGEMKKKASQAKHTLEGSRAALIMAVPELTKKASQLPVLEARRQETDKLLETNKAALSWKEAQLQAKSGEQAVIQGKLAEIDEGALQTELSRMGKSKAKAESILEGKEKDLMPVDPEMQPQVEKLLAEFGGVIEVALARSTDVCARMAAAEPLAEQEETRANLLKTLASREKTLTPISTDMQPLFYRLSTDFHALPADAALDAAIAKNAEMNVRIQSAPELEKDLAFVEARLKALGISIAQAETDRGRYQKVVDRKAVTLAFVEEETILQAWLRDLKQDREHLAKKVEDMNASLKRLSELKARAATLQGIVSTRAKEKEGALKLLNEKLDQARSTTDLLNDTVCKGEGRFAACKFISNAAAMQQSIPGLEAELLRTEAAYSSPIPEEAELEAVLSEISGFSPSLESELASVSDCLRDMTVDIQKDEARLETVVRPGARNFSELETSEVELVRCNATLDSLRKESTDVHGRKGQLQQQLAEISTLRRERLALEAVIERMRFDNETRTLKEQISSLTEGIAVIRGKLESGDTLKASLAGIVAQANVLRTEGQALRAEERQLITALSQIDNEIKGCRLATEAAATKEAEIASMSVDIGDYEVLEDAYERIPFFILENVIEIMEDEANKVLQEISSNGMRLELRTDKAGKNGDSVRDELNIIVSDEAGERPIELYSGGEKTRQILAIAVGLAELSARRAGTKISTLFIDEPAGLDAQGLRDFGTCFIRLVEAGVFKKGFLMAHEELLKEVFEQKIVVSKEGTESRVEVIA